MTVVRFRTRIGLTIVDGAPVDPQVALALEATDAALGRAVARAASLRLLGGVVPADVDPRIDIRFSGEPLPADVEERMRAALRSGILARARTLVERKDADRPATERDAGRGVAAAEEYDDRRVIVDADGESDDGYVLPSFGGGKAVAVPVRGAARSRRADDGTALQLHEFESLEELEDWINAHFADDPPPRLVAVVAEGGKAAAVLCLMGQGGTGGGVLLDRRFLGYIRVTDPRVAGSRELRVLRADTLRFVKDAMSPDEVRETREALVKRFLRGEPGGGHVAEVELDRQARSLVARMVPPKPPVRYLELLAGGAAVITIESDDHTPDTRSELPVAVMSERVAAPRERERVVGVLPLGELPIHSPDPSKPFLAEPTVDFWPPDVSADLVGLVADVARRLGMRPGVYPGMFVLAAYVRIAELAVSYGALRGRGASDVSPRSLELAELAGAFQPLERLVDRYTRLIGYGRALPFPLQGNGPSWVLHFREEYVGRVDFAVASMFVGACQDLLLLRLEASRRELQRRRSNFDAYMKTARVTIRVMLADEGELRALRSILLATQGATGPTLALPVSGDAITAWFAVGSSLVAALTDAARGGTAGSTPAPVSGRVRVIARGVVQVQDASGRWWSRDDLDATLAASRKDAFAADPLLEKLADLPDVVERLRGAGPDGLDAEFLALIDDLLELNGKKTDDVRAHSDIAFGMAHFSAADFSDSDVGAKLSGIHKLADEFLRPLFPGELRGVYTAGVAYLAGVEIGKEAFHRFFGLVGMTAIAIFCPPLAFAIGVVEAIDALETAQEHVELQRSMLGSDDIMTMAEAEAERWGAAIGVALAFIPEVGTIARGTAGAAKAVWRREVGTAVRSAGRRAARQFATHLAEVAAEGVAKVYVVECLKGYVLDLAINAAIGRVTDAVEREVAVSGSLGVLDIPQIVGDAFRGAPGAKP